MKQFHSLTVLDKRQETRDSVRVSFQVPETSRDDFNFLAGQHLPLQIKRDGRVLRRTYSICSEQGSWPLEIGVRIQPGGEFSEFVANDLNPGDQLDVMPPNGQFHASIDADNEKQYLGFAAGSGITPIISIISTVLRNEKRSQFTLFYGNRTQASTMFIDDLYALKNRYPDRLQMHFLFSQEEQEFEIASGRLDAAKVRELHACFLKGRDPAEVYVCGPDSMIQTVTETLVDLGIPGDAIHAERFGAPRKSAPAAPVAVAAAESADVATITIVMDGHKKSFAMARGGLNIVDAAAREGVDLPFSCKGGVCATCRTHVRQGEVKMASNYGLEPWEVDKGYVLACQSTPVSEQVLLDYDKT